nr:DUF1801 domain-containing protein [Demequina pelophila]
MRERAREAKRAQGAQADAEACAEKIAEMEPADRELARRVHDLVTSTAPELAPKTWYGMPAYAKDGKVVCFFQSGAKFSSRYATFGFQDVAALDDGAMWATSFALVEVTDEVAARIVDLVTRAVT